MEIDFRKTVYSRADVVEIAIYWLLTAGVLLFLLIDVKIELAERSSALASEISSNREKTDQLESKLSSMAADEKGQCALSVISVYIMIKCEDDELSSELKKLFDQHQFDQVQLSRFTENEVADYNLDTTQKFKEMFTISPKRTPLRESFEATAFRKFLNEMDHNTYNVFYKGKWCATISPELIQQIDLRVLCGEKDESKSQTTPKPIPQKKSEWKDL